MTTKIMANNNFFYYNQEIRVSILQSIHNKLKMNYSLWEIKQSTIRGFDSDKVFLQSIS